MSFDHAASFGRGAAAYAARRPTYPAALWDWLAGPRRELAVDVATGGGQAAVALAERFDRVIATDMSAELVATVPARPNLRTLVQRAEDLDVEPADLVVVAQALHWFAEPAFFERVRRSLRPGGRFAAFGYCWLYVDAEIDAVVHGALIGPSMPHWSPKNQLLFDGYRTIDVPMREIEAPSFTIEVEWTAVDLLAYVGTWSAIARMREQGIDPVPEVAPRLRALWPDRRLVRMPLAMRAFTP
jgi:SAM-dependent methyltransferase